MIAFLVGLVVGIAACENAGRHVGGYSIVGDVVDWIRGRW
jgi:hypothetical protein